MRARALRRAECRGAARAPSGRSRVRESRPAGRPVAAGHAAACRSRSRHTVPSSSTRCAATRSCRRGRGSRCRRASRSIVGSDAHPQVLEDVVGHVERVHEVPPGVDVDAFAAAAARRCARGVARRGAADPPNPRQRERAAARRGQRRAARGVLRRRRADGRLLRQAHPQQGRPPAARGAATARRAGGDRRLRRLPRGARGAARRRRTLFTGRSSTGTSVHLLPLRDVAVVPSIFPEAFGMVAAEAACAGVPPLVARHSGLAEVAEGIEDEYPPELRHLSASRTATSPTSAKLAQLLALARPTSARRGWVRRRAARPSSGGAGRASPQRLLEPFAAAV